MSEPLIYISTWKNKGDKLEDFKRITRELVEIYEANEPQLIAFNIFLDEEGTEMTSIQASPPEHKDPIYSRVHTLRDLKAIVRWSCQRSY